MSDHPPEHRHVRLAEIAGTAGVSKATVSRALRDAESVSAASLAKVRQALAILGATGQAPSAGTGDGAGSGPQLIALIKPAVSAGNVDPYSRLAEILTNRMFSLGIAVVHIEAIAERNETLLETILGSEHGGPEISGAIVVGGGAAGVLAGMLAERGLPLIRISNARHDDGISRIYLDATGGIDTAVAHLVHLGHKRIGLAVLRDSAAPARIAGFRRSMAGILHIPATRDQAPVVEAAGGAMAGVAAAEELLDLRCTAVIACAPSLSFGMLEAAQRLRLDVPRDLSLLTVGDVPDADVVQPPLSQVVYDWATVAQSAIDEIRAMISAGDARVHVDYTVDPDLVLRASAVPPQRR
ncbi:DNA-binding transcriptional regulator, LacI/PurR family [Brevibacterium siliguriense]|uniref:DNA-binding transcriptional regulator, LacI/PurR family n=1 Tax=Brevibacterium siliguriense TaxID=1136497 RepID=A0A1H1PTI8_9MICO|nr:LacI family DNA-binding transcriptional regulator [Brevibacterium siliguriense]SDS14436.1 DNA-binding transcriptional regulator, LacI/PurR family [Brevibacterium siliguriense]